MAMQNVKEVENKQPISNKAKITIAVVAALLLALFSYGSYSWWSGRAYREVLAMVNEEVNYEDLSNDEKRARFEKYRTLEKKLTRDQREVVDTVREKQYEKKDMQRLNTFFAMPAADKQKKLVDEVNAEEKRRKEFDAKRKEWEAKKAQGGGGKGGQAGAGQGGRGQGGQAGAAGPGVAGQGGQAGAAGPGAGGQNQPQVAGAAPQQGGRPPSTPESRNKRTSDRLDNSTPEYRAARVEYQKLKEQVKTQMGLTTTNTKGGALGGGAPGGGGRPPRG